MITDDIVHLLASLGIPAPLHHLDLLPINGSRSMTGQLYSEGVNYPNIKFKSEFPVSHGVGISFLDKTETEQRMLYYNPVQDLIIFGDTSKNLELDGLITLCVNTVFRNFQLDSQATGKDGALWYDSSWGIVGYKPTLFYYLASSYRLRFPTSAPTSPSAGDAYFDAPTETLNIWNGTDYTSFKGA